VLTVALWTEIIIEENIKKSKSDETFLIVKQTTLWQEYDVRMGYFAFWINPLFKHSIAALLPRAR
jgi:hypothetical protein